MDDLQERFALVDRDSVHGLLEAHPHIAGLSKKWLLQFRVEYLPEDVDDNSLSRSLEAFLLWMFGYVMINNSHGNCVDRVLMPYARAIAEAEDDELGFAVLAATYEACATPAVSPIHKLFDGLPTASPTVGKTWAHMQVRRVYLEFVKEFDRLHADDMIWEPYSADQIAMRAPLGLSSLSTRDDHLWLTTAPLVYDYMVEPHCPDRVMRQFGFAQPWPIPVGPPRVLANMHRSVPNLYFCTLFIILSRSGLPFSSTWLVKLAPMLQYWAEADEHVVEPIGPHTDESFRAYLAWYQPRMRCHITYAEEN
ncbi:hypothetical protein U9M48_021847 [Paspalum notatum var. saurae]|uniref:Aminotransferase-like plant mobile domain-containing protein n=1 Tax=Paspalum notatum var. saurae TaxID=547442 RepID=A0AAQ3WU37_PASNO